MRGNIVLNGVPIEPSKLTDRVAYVKTDHHFTPDMSVRQTMLFHAFLREPGSHSRARDTKGMKYISLIKKKITLSHHHRTDQICPIVLSTNT